MASSSVIDRHRVVPRVILAFILYFGARIALWFMELQAPSAEQSAFASAYMASLVAFCKFYMDNPKYPVSHVIDTPKTNPDE